MAMVIALLKVVELLHSGTVSLSYPVAFGVNKCGEEDHKDLEYEIVIIEGGKRQGNPVEDIKYMEELIFDYVLCFPQFTNYDGDLETPRLPFGFRNLRDNMIATMEYKASVKANRTSNFSIIAVNTQLPLTKGYLIKPSTADNFSLKNHVLVPLDRNNDGREYETTLEAWLSEYETIHSELFRVKVSSFGKLHQIVQPTIKGLVMVIALLKVVELLHSGTVSLSYPVAFGVNKFGEEDHKDLEYEIVIIEGGERQGLSYYNLPDMPGIRAPDPITTFPDMPGIGNMCSVKFGKDAKYLAAGTVDWNILLFGLPEEDNLLESEH
ncbi:hypothetical protein POM88_011536 [Heracleum sosnowskyi]|uniref:Uncharacterized protein n=1 Tax=Heracleum sosnowskyi TaxID=360622 RepID=A0AAD8IV31_9APIA|nr:hypothetical protein POM88_011536 [Heracleum sosnowskyi]